MSGPATKFRSHCEKGIRNFVQTAVVIDNEARLDFGSSRIADATPRVAVPPPVSVLESVVAPLTGEKNDAQPQSEDGNGTKEDAKAAHELDAKALTDAFHNIEVVCGLYKPVPGEESVGLATKAARHADVVVLDWYLEPNSNDSSKAKEVIRSILRQDYQEKGRLRLIAIYTGAPGLDQLAKEVFGDLQADPNLKDTFQLSQNPDALTRGDVRICFFNKPHTIGVPAGDVVLEADLPSRVIREFAVVTEGVLATFAVNAIAAVRRATHHVISLFRKELDGAYLAHRCRLQQPEEAEEFVSDLIGEELRNVIALAGVADESVGSGTLEAWVDHVTTNNGHTFRNFKANEQYETTAIKDILRNGLDAAKKSFTGKKLRDIESVFYRSRFEAWQRNLEFARLTNLKREGSGRTRLPDKWRPSLSLGSILKALRTRPETEKEQERYEDLPFDYFVCVQPGCHSVRLKGETAFPCQTASWNEEKFNLVVRDNTKCDLPLLVGWKPREAVLLRFEPEGDGSVRASPSEEGFVFTDKRGRRFLWLADLKDLKAQRSASELAQFIHTAAVDDLEWLRLAGEGGGIDFEARIAESANPLGAPGNP
jgi:hypothetical protein